MRASLVSRWGERILEAFALDRPLPAMTFRDRARLQGALRAAGMRDEAVIAGYVIPTRRALFRWSRAITLRDFHLMFVRQELDAEALWLDSLRSGLPSSHTRALVQGVYGAAIADRAYTRALRRAGPPDDSAGETGADE